MAALDRHRAHPRTRRAALLGGLTLLLLTRDAAEALNPDKLLTQYVQDVWDTAAGLPQNTAWALAQTTDGYLWIGTEEGLARFDGVRFTTYDRGTTPSMPAANVQALLGSPDGRLWIGTYGGGLLLFDGTRFVAFGEKEGLRGHSILAMTGDGEGGLWVGTERGLSRFREGRFVAPPDAAQVGAVKSLLRDSRGALWVGTDQGLTRLLPAPSRLYTHRDGLPRAAINALHEDGHGVLWVGTARGFARRTGDRFVTHTSDPDAADDFVYALAGDADGGLWIATNGGGLQRLLGGRLQTLRARDGFPGDFLVSLLVDREGSLWVGSRGRGLVRLKEGDFVTLGRREGLASEVVDSIHGSRAGGLWVGGNGGHLARIRPDGRIQALPTAAALNGSSIRALHEDRRGDLWIGTWLGLHRLGKSGIGSIAGDGLSNVRVVVEDGAGSVWVGTDSAGLFRLQAGTVRHYTTRDGLPNDQVRALHEDRQGRLWIGTYGGLARFDDGRFQTYTTAHGLPSDLVRTLYEDAEGALWIATYGGGIARLRDGRLQAWGTPHGLFTDVAYEILEDGRGNLWMSSNRGVHRVARRDLEDFQAGRISRVHSVHYGASDGLASEECNGGNPSGWRTPDGRLWFLTVRGVVVVDPARLRSARPPPPAAMEEILVDGRAVETGGPTEIEPGSHSIELLYTALTLADAERLRFRYRLVGFDRDWKDVGGRRAAYFTGLPHGRYRFEVAASLEGEAWPEATASHAFRVRPRFYETPLFYLLAVVAAVSAGIALQQLRVWRMRAAAAALKAEVEAALAKVKVLSGMLPVCAWCKQVRDDQGYWSEIETYISSHTQAEFTHGICPRCAERMRAGRGA